MSTRDHPMPESLYEQQSKLTKSEYYTISDIYK